MKATTLATIRALPTDGTHVPSGARRARGGDQRGPRIGGGVDATVPQRGVVRGGRLPLTGDVAVAAATANTRQLASERRIRLLVTNDIGIYSSGIVAPAHVAAAIGDVQLTRTRVAMALGQSASPQYT